MRGKSFIFACLTLVCCGLFVSPARAQETTLQTPIHYSPNFDPAKPMMTIHAAGNQTGDLFDFYDPSGNLGCSISASAAQTCPVIDKGGQVFNVKAYGAKGDGVTNDTAAFQAALNAAGSGGTIYVPLGNYVITATLNVPPYASIQGESGGIDATGSGVNILWDSSANGPVISETGTFITSVNNESRGSSIKGLTLSNISSAPALVGIAIYNIVGLQFDDLNINWSGGICFSLNSTSSLWVERTSFGPGINASCGSDITMTTAGGTGSFAYTHIIGSHLDGTALSVGSGSILYHSVLDFSFNSGNPVISNAGIVNETLVGITGEGCSSFLSNSGTFDVSGWIDSSCGGVSGTGTSILSIGPRQNEMNNLQGLNPYGTSGPTFTLGTALVANPMPTIGLSALVQAQNNDSTGGEFDFLIGGISDGRSGVRIYNAYPFSSHTPLFDFTNNGFALIPTVQFGSSAGPTLSAGSGAPSGSCTTGSLYSNTGGAAGSTIYACVSGAWSDVK